MSTEKKKLAELLPGTDIGFMSEEYRVPSVDARTNKSLPLIEDYVNKCSLGQYSEFFFDPGTEAESQTLLNDLDRQEAEHSATNHLLTISHKMKAIQLDSEIELLERMIAEINESVLILKSSYIRFNGEESVV